VLSRKTRGLPDSGLRCRRHRLSLSLLLKMSAATPTNSVAAGCTKSAWCASLYSTPSASSWRSCSGVNGLHSCRPQRAVLCSLLYTCHDGPVFIPDVVAQLRARLVVRQQAIEVVTPRPVPPPSPSFPHRPAPLHPVRSLYGHGGKMLCQQLHAVSPAPHDHPFLVPLGLPNLLPLLLQPLPCHCHHTTTSRFAVAAIVFPFRYC